MKLVTFELATDLGRVERVGALVGDDIVDLTLAYADLLRSQGEARAYELATCRIPPDMIKFFEGGKSAHSEAEKALKHVNKRLKAEPDAHGERGEKLVHKRDQVKLLAPVPLPNSVRDTLNFEQHMKNALSALNMSIPKLWYEIPAYYSSNRGIVAGTDDPILWPKFTEKLDYELEYGIYIGKYGVNIPESEAEEYIAGYTIYNDVSARDILSREMSLWTGPAKGKNFLNGHIMGPCVVTPDEIGDPYNLKMVARVNGEVWSQGNSKDMFHKFPKLIAYISQDEPLFPGDFIGSGCVPWGCCLELGKWIKPGDMIEMEVERIGVLRNRVERNR